MRTSRKIRLSYAIALAAFVAGIIASLAAGDWSWFSRSGSFVVAVGIMLTSTQIIEHDRRLKKRRMRWEAQVRRDMGIHAAAQKTSLRDWAHEPGLGAMTESRVEEEDYWEREHDGLHMLVAGTLVWGFGDLVGYLPWLGS